MKILVELWILTYNIPSDTHEVVKHMTTLENTSTRVYMYVSIALASSSWVKILVDSSAIVGWQIIVKAKRRLKGN